MLGLVCLNLFVPPSWVVHHLPPTLSCEEGSRVAELYGWYERNRLAGLSVTSNYDSIASGGSSKGADSGRLYEPSRLPDLTDTFPCMWDVSSIALFMAKWPFEASMLRDSPDVDERPQQGLRRLSEGDLRARGLPSRPSKAKHLLLVQRTTCPYRAVLHIGKNCMEWKLDGLKLLGGGALKWKGMQLLKESQHNSTKGIWPQRARTVQGGFVQNLLEMLDKVSCFDDPRLIQGFNLLSDGVANQVSDAARDSNRDGQPLQAGNDDERLVQASRGLSKVSSLKVFFLERAFLRESSMLLKRVYFLERAPLEESLILSSEFTFSHGSLLGVFHNPCEFTFLARIVFYLLLD
ncbi:hypothetical protein CRG98_002952 [Punica granatum]|uniref:Uncharacterized protein n=1 Tax=Punica granatum TaxID=22663 RepID=A0A2I0L7M9_PUNGR|nr:hypothetical protein CRG98_002952 [Punica granatum]